MEKIKVNGTSFQKRRVGGYGYGYTWYARKGGFKFSLAICRGTSTYYLTVEHSTKDIRWNSLWQEITWPNVDDAMKFATQWNAVNYKCIGCDVAQF